MIVSKRRAMVRILMRLSWRIVQAKKEKNKHEKMRNKKVVEVVVESLSSRGNSKRPPPELGECHVTGLLRPRLEGMIPAAAPFWLFEELRDISPC